MMCTIVFAIHVRVKHCRQMLICQICLLYLKVRADLAIGQGIRISSLGSHLQMCVDHVGCFQYELNELVHFDLYNYQCVI